MWAYALFGPIAGWLGDRLSRKWLILPGLIFWLFVTTATILAHRFWQFAILRHLNGIAEAIYFPAAMSLISSYHGAATLSRAMSLHQSAVYVGTIGGGVVASWLGEHFGWRSNFICFGTFGFLLSAILIFFLREPASDLSCNHNPNTSHAKNPDLSLIKMVAQVLGAPLVLRLIVAFIGANFVAMVFMVWLPAFLYGKFKLTLAMAGMNATLYLQLAAIGGVLVGGSIADSLTRRDPLAIAFGSQHFSMGTCLSATSVIYAIVAAILLWNIRPIKRRGASNTLEQQTS